MAAETDYAELTLDTSLGPIRLQADGRGLTRIILPGSGDSGKAPSNATGTDHPLLVEAARQIREYLAGERTVFTLPLAPSGTRFQLQVWEIISQIPWGKTMTYGAIARQLGQSSKARAVGGAAGANPLPLVIPCHRVIGADGRLTGFACGLAMKELLLRQEGVLSAGLKRRPLDKPGIKPGSFMPLLLLQLLILFPRNLFFFEFFLSDRIQLCLFPSGQTEINRNFSTSPPFVAYSLEFIAVSISGI